jgi:phosphate transport system permease protein
LHIAVKKGLLIAVLIFNLSARFLGQKLYQHLTAAKQG